MSNLGNLIENPLVSIVVITYNSSKFILETLESAKAQTYKNIELIISDDCSKDETVNICKDWLRDNKERFERTEMVTTLTNTGTATNLNRGINKANGTWIKYIAGDDVLCPQVVSKYIEYIKGNPHVEFLHSKVVHYNESFDEKNKLPLVDASKYKINKPDLSPNDQFEILLRASPIGTPTVMIKRTVFEKVGLFDERFPLWEDRPMYLKITGSGIKLQFLDIVGAKYRVRLNSVAHNKNNQNLFSNFKINKLHGYEETFLRNLSGTEYFFKNLLYQVELFFYKNFNKNVLFIKLFYKSLVLPLRYLNNRIDRKFR